MRWPPADEAPASPPGSRPGAGQVALTVALLVVIGLLNLYLYTVADRASSPLLVSSLASHAYYLLILVSALFSTGRHLWIGWGSSSAACGAYAAVHPDEPGVALVWAAFSVIAGGTVMGIRRLRIERATYEEDLAALDVVSAEARKRLDEQSALFEVGQMMALTFDIGRLFEDTMSLVEERLHMHRGVLSLYDADAGELVIEQAYGVTPEMMLAGKYRLAEDIYAQVLERGKPMAAPNIGDAPIALGAEVDRTEARHVAFLCVPILMEAETVGVLSVDRAPADERTLADDLHFLTILASVFAQALKIQQMIDDALAQDRLASLGKMARSVAHEVRNPLGGIRGAAQLLQMDLAEAETEGEAADEAQGYTRIIIEEVDRLNRVVEQLLYFGSAPTSEYAKVDIVEVVEHVAFLVKSDAAAHGVTVVKEFASARAVLQGDEDELKQALLNIARNAVEAMPDGGELRLGVTPTASAGKGTAASVEVSVSDTGVGLPAEAREEIFSPLYTTKQKGTGIGLALTKRIVEEHGGYIAVEDGETCGSRFRVVLPANDAADVG
ncbi:GAF domain-containing protein [Candidatus Poribacteria bacterium]|nr:GAF domain-containing protein [Candidatus Poribacteria bacterium]MBT7100816.1 GAF domain-containing protein [Candidatus Poribacteria bacterium]